MSAAPLDWNAAAFILEPVANSLECGVLLIDEQERIVFASRPLAAMFGTTVEAITAMSSEQFVQYAAGLVDDPPQLLRERRVLPQGAHVVCEEFELVGACRSVVRWVARRMTTPWPGKIVVCTDITAEVDLTAAFERLAVTDGLTGLSNRRGAEQAISREIGRTRRYGWPLSFALLDIDHFKKINDGLGHSTGDQILRQVGRVIGSSVRDCDIAARWGGEEFLVILPNTGLDAGRSCAERIRAAVEKLPLGDKHVTISGGVSEVATGEAASDAISRADERLYVAKASGRNRIC